MTKTVLVVDDSSFITEGLASLLKKKYRIIIASGGQMCLEILRKESPDIIILDILMEPMDGWETLLHIRENPLTRTIPVIMFSAKKISPFEAETHHPYIDDYLTKPVSPRNLLDTIAKVLARKEASRRNLELWKKAGLDSEEIEEYARLMTSIEVDRGLCSNLKLQLSTDFNDVPHDEIRRSVEIIGARIHTSMTLADAIEQKGNSLVASRADLGVMADLPITEDSSMEPHLIADLPLLETYAETPVISMADNAGSQDIFSAETASRKHQEHCSLNDQPEIPAKDPAEDAPGMPERNCVFSGTPEASAPNPDPVPLIKTSPGTGTNKVSRTRENELIAKTDLVVPETLPNDKPESPHLPAFPVLQKNENRVPETAKTLEKSTGGTRPRVQEAPAPAPVQHTPVSHKDEDRKITKIPPSAVRKEPAVTTKSGKKQGNLDVHTTATPEKAPPSPGIISRIISAIMSIFSRPKQ